MDIRIYFEGSRSLKIGFDRFFAALKESARKRGSRIELVAARSGISDYRKAARTHPGAWNILLKDSEKAVRSDRAALCNDHGIDPARANDVFWMVELMESWFLAQPEVVEKYYTLPQETFVRIENVERISKSDVYQRLKDATRNTTKGEYHKVQHAPFLLERLDADQVQTGAPHCRQLFETIRARV